MLVTKTKMQEIHKSNMEIYGTYYKNTIYINIEDINSEIDLYNTLAHEMVHLLLEIEGCKESHHGNKFQNYRRKIKRKFNISI